MSIISDYKKDHVPMAENVVFKLSEIEGVAIEILTVNIKDQMGNKFGEPTDTAIVTFHVPEGNDGVVFIRQPWLVDIFRALYNHGVPNDLYVKFVKKTSKKGTQYWDVIECDHLMQTHDP